MVKVVVKEEKLFSEDEFLCDPSRRDLSDSDEDSRLMYHCTECAKNFLCHSAFKKHMDEHVVRLQNSCALCSQEFPSKQRLQVSWGFRVGSIGSCASHV